MNHPTFHCFCREQRYFVINRSDCIPFEIDARSFELLQSVAAGQAGAGPTGRLSEFERAWNRIEALGILSPDPESDREHSQRACRVRQVHGEPSQITLHLTTECNLRCTYCYVPTEDRRRMTLNTALAAVEWLVSRPVPSPQKIVFFGGEPLLEIETMKAIMGDAQRIYRTSGKRLSFAVTTNGTLIDDRVAEWLADSGLSVTISFDGARAHQLHRRFPDGRSSLQATLSGIHALRVRGVPFDIRATMTECLDIDELIGSVVELSDSGALSLSSASASFASGGSNDAAGIAAERFTAACLRMGRCALDQAKERSGLTHREAVGMLRRGGLGAAVRSPEAFAFERIYSRFKRKRILAPCGAADTFFAVGPRGQIYPCHRFVGVGGDAHVLGDVNAGIDSERLGNWHRRIDESCRACSDCWAGRLCGGGCYWEKSSAGGAFGAIDSRRCDAYRDLFEGLICLTAESE